MGFDILAQADPIRTRKDNEFVQVQVVHITPDAKFKNVAERVQVEMRLVFEGQGRLVGTKQAFVFENADDVTEMIAALQGALAVFNGSDVQGLIPVPAPTPVPVQAKPIRKIGAAAAPAPAPRTRKAAAPAAAKPVARKRPARNAG